MAEFVPPSEYIAGLRSNGFKTVEACDLTDKMRPSITRLGKLRLPVWPTANIALAPGKAACRVGLYDKARLRGIEGGACLVRALRAGLWTCAVLWAEK